MSSRNVAVASLVVLPGMAVGAAGLGAVDGLRRSRAALGIVAVCVVAGCVLGVSALDGPRHPAAPLPGAGGHLARGARAASTTGWSRPTTSATTSRPATAPAAYVFIDDRVDMYPAAVVDDSLVLLRAEPGWQEALDRYEPGAVLWPKDKPLTPLLRASDAWRPVYEDADWMVFEPA